MLEALSPRACPVSSAVTLGTGNKPRALEAIQVLAGPTGQETTPHRLGTRTTAWEWGGVFGGGSRLLAGAPREWAWHACVRGRGSPVGVPPPRPTPAPPTRV